MNTVPLFLLFWWRGNSCGTVFLQAVSDRTVRFFMAVLHSAVWAVSITFRQAFLNNLFVVLIFILFMFSGKVRVEKALVQ